MKKLFVLSIGILSASILSAQKPHWGIKGGVNASALSFKGADDSKYKYGFHAGLLTHIHATNTFAIQPEVYYSQQGGKQTINNVDSRYNLNYINIPVLGQIMFGKGSRLMFGPQLGLLVNAEQSSGQTHNKITDNYKSTDFSFVLGYSYLGPKQLGFDVRYNFGMSNINKNTAGISTYNNVAQAGIFYQFDHRGKR
jgi:hypothetical protein